MKPEKGIGTENETEVNRVLLHADRTADKWMTTGATGASGEPSLTRSSLPPLGSKLGQWKQEVGLTVWLKNTAANIRLIHSPAPVSFSPQRGLPSTPAGGETGSMREQTWARPLLHMYGSPSATRTLCCEPATLPSSKTTNHCANQHQSKSFITKTEKYRNQSEVMYM